MSIKTEKRKTSAEIKAEIEEATKAMKDGVKNGNLPLTPGVVSEINASESTPEATLKTESKPQPEKAAEPVMANNSSVNYEEWAKKKGIDWTTDSSVLAALYKSDQEWHRKRAEDKAKAPPVQNIPPQPPSLPYGYQAPAYVPPPNHITENIARQYNMTPEDVQRLSMFNRDFFEVLMKQERERQDKELEAFKIENQKNSVFRELSADPVFRNPAVAVEFHSVLEQMQNSDPVSFEKDPLQYRRAYDRALANIGRRNLEGKPLIEGTVPVALPVTPPKPLGQMSGGGYNDQENTIDPETFAKASLEDKRKILEGMGLRPTY